MVRLNFSSKNKRQWLIKSAASPDAASGTMCAVACRVWSRMLSREFTAASRRSFLGWVAVTRFRHPSRCQRTSAIPDQRCSGVTEGVLIGWREVDTYSSPADRASRGHRAEVCVWPRGDLTRPAAVQKRRTHPTGPGAACPHAAAAGVTVREMCARS